MTALREAAQQALAFTMRDFATMRDFEAARAVLHDDLRAALKQEEEASAWLAERKEYWRKEKEKMQATNALRAVLAQQAEAVQEPVLVVEKEPDYWSKGHFHQGSKPHIDPTKVWNLPIGTKLYTTPPQRTMVPLTEDEIYHATGHCGVSRYTAINITRAVEKASWEKNHGQA